MTIPGISIVVPRGLAIAAVFSIKPPQLGVILLAADAIMSR